MMEEWRFDAALGKLGKGMGTCLDASPTGLLANGIGMAAAAAAAAREDTFLGLSEEVGTAGREG